MEPYVDSGDKGAGYDVYIQYTYEEYPQIQHFNTEHSASVSAQLHAFTKWDLEKNMKCNRNILSMTTCGKRNAYVFTNPDTDIERLKIWYIQSSPWKDKVHLVCVKKKGQTRVEYYKPRSVARVVALRYAGKERALNSALAKEKDELEIHEALQHELTWDKEGPRFHILNAETNEVMKIWVEEIKLNQVVMLD